MNEIEPGKGTVAPDGRPDTQQPAWRQEFPIDVAQDHYVTRRGFTKFLGLTSLAFAVGQLWIGVQSWFRARQSTLPRQAIAELADVPVGSFRTFHYPEDGDVCLLARLGEEKLVAYSQKCTHLSCAIVPDAASARLHCPCHQGIFDLDTGRPLAGPPRRPLTRINLEVTDGVIHATGLELRAL